MAAETGNSQSTKREIDTELLVESLVIMAFAAFLYGVSDTFEEVPPILAQGIQPTAFPRGIIIIMFLLGALQALKAIRLSPERMAALKPYKRIPLIVYLTAATLIGFAIVLPWLGTFPALALFCPILAILWGERRWVMMVLSFAGFIAFIYVLFILLLDVPLP
ncbi:MAG: tripartite tricarboxylate transporter TctB family protein [Pseudomonadota bacterium]